MIFDAIPDSNQQYQLGVTKVFMRESLERTLEKERVQMLRGAVVTVQKYARGILGSEKGQEGSIKCHSDSVRLPWVPMPKGILKSSKRD